MPYVFEEFGGRRADPYDWLRKKKGDPDVVRHLKAENAYAAARLAPIGKLIERPRRRAGRADNSDEGPDYVENGYLYQRRIAEGARFPVVTRRRTRSDRPQVVLDVESFAAGHGQYDLNEYTVSPDGNLVAFAVDFTGGRLHQIFIRDIAAGRSARPESRRGLRTSNSRRIRDTCSTSAPKPARCASYQLWRHTVGTDRRRTS